MKVNATEDDVRFAYRLFLNRSPDRSGFEHYAKLVEKGLTLFELSTHFLNSEEFRRGRQIVPQTVEMEPGLFVSVDPNDSEFAPAILKSRSWEPHIISIIKRSLNPGDCFVDVGANVGVMSFHAAKIVGANGKVISFEPNPDNASRFLAGVELNNFTQVILHQFALSDARGIAYLQGGSNTNLTFSPSERRALSIRGDDILESETKIDLIKIDIEGFEKAAIEGMAKSIHRTKPKILCEFNPRCLRAHAQIDPKELAIIFFDLAPRISAIEHDGTLHTLTTPQKLIELWDHQNHRAVTSGLLPDGMLHFDVLLEVR
jgi:FkbM family methyltransferase